MTHPLSMDGSTETRFMGYVGMPLALHLGDFALQVKVAFDGDVYLVGSATQRKDWRDLDVVVIISDELWVFGEPSNRFLNPKWRAFVAAFSLLGEKMTGARIDFQIHPKTYAEDHYTGPRILIS